VGENTVEVCVTVAVVEVVSLSKDKDTSVVVVGTVTLCQETENTVTVDDVVVDVVSVLTVVNL
jgi:hypothetical protein